MVLTVDEERIDQQGRSVRGMTAGGETIGMIVDTTEIVTEIETDLTTTGEEGAAMIEVVTARHAAEVEVRSGTVTEIGLETGHL